MYESPINFIHDQIRLKILEEEENKILQAVQTAGVFVDKEELIKALAYDREQYQKGYQDRDDEIVRCRDCIYWHSNTEFCDVWSHANIAQRTLADDYCSRGERRDGEA